MTFGDVFLRMLLVVAQRSGAKFLEFLRLDRSDDAAALISLQREMSDRCADHQPSAAAASITGSCAASLMELVRTASTVR